MALSIIAGQEVDLNQVDADREKLIQEMVSAHHKKLVCTDRESGIASLIKARRIE